MSIRRLQWLGASLLALLLIAGCGGSHSSPALSPSASQTSSTGASNTPASGTQPAGAQGEAHGGSQVAISDPAIRGTNPDDSQGAHPPKARYLGGAPERPPASTPDAPDDAPPSEPAPAFADLDAAERGWLASSRKSLGPAVNVKGIYVSGSAAASPAFLNSLIGLVDRTELNAMVVDIKSDWGQMTFHSTNPVVIAAGEQGGGIADLRAFVQRLHAHHIYVIGRLVTFKDLRLAKSHPSWMIQNKSGGPWLGYGDTTWVDPTNHDAWRYMVSVGKEAAAAGFDEIQFDYVRFPSDGPMSQIVYPDLKGKEKAQVIGDFLAYAREQLHPYGVRVSGDVFGLVTSVSDDMGIGQHLEDAAAGLDYISPMTYPSHYSRGNLGVEWPNNDPYAILKHSMDDAIGRINAAGLKGVQVRPWLQDFTYGHPDNPAVEYGAKQVRAQIQATYDAGGKSWLLWNAANRYTEDALLPKGKD